MAKPLRPMYGAAILTLRAVSVQKPPFVGLLLLWRHTLHKFQGGVPSMQQEDQHLVFQRGPPP